ncbi:MAG: PxxKW family cysteine-rich protein [Dissulfurimicrobium sp.]|uniref:PxxKW family cysteine-rich protein n=1 Tax=Dissulfurimicrobium TaxID=1769732 RepID=UPI001EDAC3B9|nr:PxxKW family cysteine-rich protein [Dissulfurimicrobium hydrothermale]UKL14162.1 PxxKW family cysteine-rich protein [Dissulfurimicrobium hydrothermale]
MEHVTTTGASTGTMMFKGILCEEIIDKCKGCARIMSWEGKEYCSVYSQPAMKWRKGICNFATHVKVEVAKDESGKKINPLKAAKRAARGR